MVITNPVIAAGTSSITISWTVNNSQAHSGVSYGPPGNVNSITNYDPNATGTPSYTLTGFQPGEVIVLRMFSFYNGQTASLQVSATTKAADPTITSVAASCAAPSLAAGASESCTAAVGGTGSYSSAVTWSTTAGTITSSGLLTAPTSGTSAVVKATSVQDPTKFATMTISITPKAAVSKVAINCPATTLNIGANMTCAATVTGSGSYSSTVTWTASTGTVTSGGLVTAPMTGTALTLTATSTQDATMSASSTIAITQNLAIFNPVFSATPTTIVLSWNVTQAAHSGVDYNNGPGTGWSTTPYTQDTTTTPSFTFTGLTPGTTYSGIIFSFNGSGTVTQNVTVTTPLQ